MEDQTLQGLGRKINITTSYGSDVIEQTLDIRGEIYRRVVNTQDAQIREALIKMGWTPPIN